MYVFLEKFINLQFEKNEALNEYKEKQVLNKQVLDKQVFEKDHNFLRNSAWVNLRSIKGTYWVCFVEIFYFDSYGCAPHENILKNR